MNERTFADFVAIAIEQAESHRSRSELIFETVRDAIQEGALKGGGRLMEKDVARLFGTSRTPVREALQRLQERGLLALDGGRGGLVVTQVTNRRVLELYAIREVLEGAAARFAAENASRKQISTLRSLLEEVPPAGGDATTRARVNRIFHRKTYEAADNEYLGKLLTELYDELSLVRAPFHNTDPERSRESHQEHLRIVEAIADGDPDAAERAARHHIRNFQRALTQKLSEGLE